MYYPVVRVHCGSAYVRGAARKYHYLIAQLFEPQPRADGVVTYRATGTISGTYRSEKKAVAAAKALSVVYDAEYVPGYGSYHNRHAQPLEPLVDSLRPQGL